MLALFLILMDMSVVFPHLSKTLTLTLRYILYQVKVFFNSYFLECLYYEWVLNFAKDFLSIYSIFLYIYRDNLIRFFPYTY